MTRICYFECFAGASGDMLLGALIATGIDEKWFIQELKKLEDIKDSFDIKISNVMKKGISAVDVEVILTGHDHHHRGLNDITKIINSSTISQEAKDLAIKIFTNLAIAEAKVHNTDINKIHFHEVGAIDSIVDIVGFSILFTSLNIDKVIVSPVNTGTGFVECAHGIMPVPAPATLEILKNSNWPINNTINIENELLTPTGSAILSTIKDEFGSFPTFKRIETVSYGAGKRELSQIANTIRLTIGEGAFQGQDICVIETNIDDMQPEIYEYIFEKLFNAGALDAFLTPIIMKKNRPANVLTVICPAEIKMQIEGIIFNETTSFGIRSYMVNRVILDRESKKIMLENLGEVSIKLGIDKTGKVISAKPEYEDCAKIARNSNIPLKEVFRQALIYLSSR